MVSLVELVDKFNKNDVITPDEIRGFLAHYGDDVPMEDTSSYPHTQVKSETDWMRVADSLISCIVNRFNNDMAYSGQDLTKDKALRDQYDAAVEKEVNRRLTSMDILSLNKIGDGAFVYSFDREAQTIAPKQLAVVHGKGMADCIEFYVNFDDNGFIVGVKPDIPKKEESALAFHSVSADEFLAHFGVKGMKWGVRKKPKQGASKDAKRAKTLKKKAKTSGLDALSNKELKDLASRIELERKFHNKQGLPLTPVQKLMEQGKKHGGTVLKAGGITSVASLVALHETKLGAQLINRYWLKGKHVSKYAIPGKKG